MGRGRPARRLGTPVEVAKPPLAVHQNCARLRRLQKIPVEPLFLAPLECNNAVSVHLDGAFLFWNAE